MCRFLLYLGEPVLVSDLITEPANSLIHQSIDASEREEPLNGDGFGLAWYSQDISPHPGVFRSISPAWSNQNLRHLARITQSGCVLAHVRAASDGLAVAESNCHPFSRGPFAFMHNGSLARFARRKRELLGLLSDDSFQAIEGSTDSEYLFAYFLDRWQESSAQLPPAERLSEALGRTIGDLVDFCRPQRAGEDDEEESYLNMAVCDGRHAAVSRFTTHAPEFAESLHLHTGKVYHCEDGVCRLSRTQEASHAVLVSSEPLSADSSWQTVPANHLVVVDGQGRADVRPISMPA